MNVTTNVNGIPYISTTNVSVSTTEVNLGLGFRRLQPVGYFTVRISNTIPADTTGTLPIVLTLNGVTRPLTDANGEAVTAADLISVSVFTVFNDRFNGILQIMSNIV